ncbi:MAG: GNAT family N-acetyltransferase [Acidimicrobiales bacterium]
MKTRAALAIHAEAIRSIYNAEVLGSTSTFDLVPRSPETQAAWLEEHSGAHPAIVAIDDSGAVAGFGSLSPYKGRPAYATTVEDSVYVHPDHRRQGVGHLLLADLVSLATAHGFHSVIARIVGHNGGSIDLHRRSGFEIVGVEKEVGRKFGQWLDVITMQLLI